MPILGNQPDIFPSKLLDDDYLAETGEAAWWIATTRPRAEKKLLGRLQDLEIPHYGPLIEKRYRSPAGRIRTSYIPLFHNYVFLLATPDERHAALTTNQICRIEPVIDYHQLIFDLRQVKSAVDSGVPLTPESKLRTGQHVIVKNGPFRGFEGRVIRREGRTRLLLTVAFLERGVSMEMDECQLTPV